MENKFKEIFEKSPIGIIFFDKEGNFTDANQSAYEIGGVTSSNDVKTMNMFYNSYVSSKKEELLEKRHIKLQAPFDFNNLKKLGVFNTTKSGIVFIDATISVIDSGFLVQIQDITERKKAESKYRALFEQNIDGVLIADLKTMQYVECNRKAEEITGYSREELLSMKIGDNTHPSIRDKILSIFCKKLKSGDTETFENKIIGKNGIKYMEISVNIIEIQGENHAQIVFKDITERKKTVKALKESQELLHAVTEGIPDPIFVKDRQSRILMANHATLLVVGKPLDQVIGKDDRDLYEDPKVGEAIMENDRRIMESGKTEVVEEIGQTPEGYRTFLSTKTPYRDKNGEVIGLLGVTRDITELKKVEGALKEARDNLEQKVEERTAELEQANESLKESELKYRTLTENSPDLIIRLDRDFRYNYINSKVSELQGKPSEFFIGKTMEEAGVPEESAELWSSSYRKVLETGKPDSLEYEYPTLNGTLSFETVSVPEFNERGEVEYILSITRDITERKKSENERKKLIEELERSNEELQSFAYITSHDLQEPLRTMGNYAGLLKRRYEGQLDEDADDFLDYMASGAARMKDMVQGLLDYSRVGTQGGEFREFSAEEALDSALINLKSAIEECHTEITRDPLPDIVADKSQITRVFQNLIGNALKFRKEGVQPEIHITAKKEDNEFIFSVRDNGIGLEEEYSDRIFEVFKRLHPIGEYHGVGIGLAVVKRIIERHGGRIWVESEFGKGSTFYFTIPIKDENGI